MFVCIFYFLFFFFFSFFYLVRFALSIYPISSCLILQLFNLDDNEVIASFIKSKRIIAMQAAVERYYYYCCDFLSPFSPFFFDSSSFTNHFVFWSLF
jgi:hypothetical protein